MLRPIPPGPSNPTIAFLATAALALALLPAAAQEPPQRLEGEVSGVGGLSIKIAVPRPASASGSDAETAELLSALRDDMTFAGIFDIVDDSLYELIPNQDAPEVEYDDWLSIGADALLRMRLSFDGSRVDLEARLYDNTGGNLIFARRYGGRSELLRRVAHQLSDELVKHYTGRSGVALTRIAFVSRHGEGKEIYLVDYDGYRLRRLTTWGTINLSPVWSPPGDELAFVSWKGRQPGVYVMSSDGVLGQLNTVGGDLSSAPAWGPDGRRLLYSSDADGNTEIYMLDRGSGRNTRLTRHPAIDTSPSFSPNGREIAFTSDRTGAPQIYIMDAEGLNVRRVSWNSSYNDSPVWSPEGDRLAYVSRIDGRFDIVVLYLATDRLVRLTRGEGDSENPSWSPDGRHIAFASNRAGGNYQIYTMHADGSRVRQLTRGEESFTPDWSR